MPLTVARGASDRWRRRGCRLPIPIQAPQGRLQTRAIAVSILLHLAKAIVHLVQQRADRAVSGLCLRYLYQVPLRGLQRLPSGVPLGGASQQLRHIMAHGRAPVERLGVVRVDGEDFVAERNRFPEILAHARQAHGQVKPERGAMRPLRGAGLVIACGQTRQGRAVACRGVRETLRLKKLVAPQPELRGVCCARKRAIRHSRQPTTLQSAGGCQATQAPL
mmetsp:Transcript_42918/g.118692  ORF Transcript_42918/g.118692 Transcript_42918/m.118692 type:complete len:220 (-) Transcript_42918:20-679(-)